MATDFRYFHGDHTEYVGARNMVNPRGKASQQGRGRGVGGAIRASVVCCEDHPRGCWPVRVPISLFALTVASLGRSVGAGVDIVGTWDVEHIAVDNEDGLHWRLQPDDSRLLGRTLVVDTSRVQIDRGREIACTASTWKPPNKRRGTGAWHWLLVARSREGPPKKRPRSADGKPNGSASARPVEPMPTACMSNSGYASMRSVSQGNCGWGSEVEEGPDHTRPRRRSPPQTNGWAHRSRLAARPLISAVSCCTRPESAGDLT
jgi:hypothetical protein